MKRLIAVGADDFLRAGVYRQIQRFKRDSAKQGFFGMVYNPDSQHPDPQH
jgi:hypothetical protein